MSDGGKIENRALCVFFSFPPFFLKTVFSLFSFLFFLRRSSSFHGFAMQMSSFPPFFLFYGNSWIGQVAKAKQRAKQPPLLRRGEKEEKALSLQEITKLSFPSSSWKKKKSFWRKWMLPLLLSFLLYQLWLEEGKEEEEEEEESPWLLCKLPKLFSSFSYGGRRGKLMSIRRCWWSKEEL